MGRKWRYPSTSCPGDPVKSGKIAWADPPPPPWVKSMPPTPILVLNPVHRSLGLSSKRKLGSIFGFCIWKEATASVWGHPWRLFLWNWQRLLYASAALQPPPSTPLVPFRSLSGSEALTLAGLFLLSGGWFCTRCLLRAHPTFPYSPAAPPAHLSWSTLAYALPRSLFQSPLCQSGAVLLGSLS